MSNSYPTANNTSVAKPNQTEPSQGQQTRTFEKKGIIVNTQGRPFYAETVTDREKPIQERRGPSWIESGLLWTSTVFNGALKTGLICATAAACTVGAVGWEKVAKNLGVKTTNDPVTTYLQKAELETSCRKHNGTVYSTANGGQPRIEKNSDGTVNAVIDLDPNALLLNQGGKSDGTEGGNVCSLKNVTPRDVNNTLNDFSVIIQQHQQKQF